MPKTSAGLLMYRRSNTHLEAFLVHPGGPFWAKKDHGAWTIPKGEYMPDEDPLAAAIREFHEETGYLPQPGKFASLGKIKQASGKIVRAWAFPGDLDPEKLTSNTCEIEWPPRSGRLLTIPEIDRGQWFSITAARTSILSSQAPFLDRLQAFLIGE